MKKQIHIIAAVAKNAVIGKDGSMPWYSPEEMKHFVKTTLGETVIMGRKTYFSIGKVLPKRSVIVVSRNKNLTIEGCMVCQSLEEALLKSDDCMGTIAWIAGGAQIYKQSLDLASNMLISHFDTEFDGDSYFPNINLSKWKIESERHVDCELAFTIKSYVKNLC